MNQGGLVVTAAMMQIWRGSKKSVGSVFYDKPPKRPREIKFVSLPGELDENGPWKMIQPDRILVVDTKFKSGGSTKEMYELLRRVYGAVEIRYAFVLTYAGWPGRWGPRGHTFPPPAHLLGDEHIEAYIAYYTDRAPDKDVIKEEFRHSWE